MTALDECNVRYCRAKYGQRCQVSPHDEGDWFGGKPEIRGWLERIDEDGVTLRVPSQSDPERPGVALTIPFKEREAGRGTPMVTCTSLVYVGGLWIGFFEPPGGEPSEDKARKFLEFARLGSDREVTEDEIAASLRYDRIVWERSLAIPLARATVWNDFGRFDEDAFRTAYGRDAFPNDEGEDE